MTPKQREFARHYANEPDAQKAAIAAGYTKQFAKSKSGAMLRNEEIIAEVNRLRQRLNERADKSATDVVNEYSKIAFADRVDFLKEDPHVPGEFIYKAPDELTPEQRAIVEKVNMRNRDIKVVNPETGEVEEFIRQEYTYVLSDKSNALQQMGRHFGIFDDKLKLVAGQSNPFKNASPEQLAQLKSSFVGIMSGGTTVDGEYTEKAKGLLPDGKRHSGSG
jgi:phage terminase small subunit